MLSKADYHYNEEKKEIEFDVSKDKVFDTGQNSMLQASAWQLLDRGDVLINISNSKSSSFLGHAAIMKDKRSYPAGSFTVEALGYGTRSQVVNYSTWHNNTWDKMAYNYVSSVYGTNKPWHAANHAERNLIGRPYDVTHALGRSNALYCTELVFLADKTQGVNLGNGMDIGNWGILMPRAMYCDADLMYYYRQNIGGSM